MSDKDKLLDIKIETSSLLEGQEIIESANSIINKVNKSLEEKKEMQNLINSFNQASSIEDNLLKIKPFEYNKNYLRKLKTSYANLEEPRLIIQEICNPQKVIVYANSMKAGFLNSFMEYFLGNIHAEFESIEEAKKEIRLFDKTYNFKLKDLNPSRAFYDYNKKYLLIELIPSNKYKAFYWPEYVYSTFKDLNILSKQKEELTKTSDFNYTSDSKLIFTTQYEDKLNIIKDTPQEAICALRELIENKWPELYVHLE